MNLNFTDKLQPCHSVCPFSVFNCNSSTKIKQKWSALAVTNNVVEGGPGTAVTRSWRVKPESLSGSLIIHSLSPTSVWLVDLLKCFLLWAIVFPWPEQYKPFPSRIIWCHVPAATCLRCLLLACGECAPAPQGASRSFAVETNLEQFSIVAGDISKDGTKDVICYIYGSFWQR